tara:strand:+ start:5914 stop:6255 length:342 start_codon:yes stop_codon:yes gene_type:complete
MGEFGWAYVDGGSITGSGGPVGAVQFLKSENALTGSHNFVFATGSDTLTMSGTAVYNGFLGGTVLANRHTINYAVEIPENYNSLLLGPITINAGVTVAIGANSNVKIKDLEDV